MIPVRYALRRVAAVTAMGAAVLALVACGDDKPSAAPTAPPPAAGFTRVIGVGFTIDMPAGWAHPPLDPAAFDRTATQLRANNPRLAQALEQARATLGAGSRLFAIDPVDGSSVNLIVVDSNKRALATVAAEAANQLQQVGVSAPRSEKATVGRLDAVRLEFALPVSGSNGTVTVPETQYYVVRGKRLFILTLFGGSPNLGTVADSLRIS